MNTHSIIAQELSKRVSTTYGAVLIGNCVGLVLYGVVLHQAFRYYRLYPRDSWILKCLVGFVVILETFNSVLNVHICYHFLTNALVNPARLTQSIWSIALLPVASGGLVVACQSFFARRIILIGRHCRPIATVVIILLIGFYIASTVEAFTTKTLERFSQVTWLFSVGSGIVTLADVIITTVLIVALRRSRTGFKGTDALIDVLILYAVNTGLLTGVFNTLAFVLSAVLPHNLVYCAVAMVDARLYANTLLAALNSRNSLARRGVMTFGSSDFVAKGARAEGDVSVVFHRPPHMSFGDVGGNLVSAPRWPWHMPVSHVDCAADPKSRSEGSDVSPVDARPHGDKTKALSSANDDPSAAQELEMNGMQMV